MKSSTVEAIWQALDDVKDPEIPVVSLVEMGIIREVEQTPDKIVVSMTPTFTGCPALQVMETDIKKRLQAMGFKTVEVKQILNPPWTSDWITPEARQKLKDFGLAPPPHHGGNLEIVLFDTVTACPLLRLEGYHFEKLFRPDAMPGDSLLQ